MLVLGLKLVHLQASISLLQARGNVSVSDRLGLAHFLRARGSVGVSDSRVKACSSLLRVRVRVRVRVRRGSISVSAGVQQPPAGKRQCQC